MRSTYYLLVFVIFASCGDDENPDVNDSSDTRPVPVNQSCSEFAPSYPSFDLESVFPRWSSSTYDLPYNVGEIYQVGQGNNTIGSHQALWRFAYDFVMDIGTEILAARGGTVKHAIDGTPDGNRQGMNLISIEHVDGTVALYLHLMQNGVLVKEGDKVKQGDLIALSGDSGNTGGVPHLHFSVHSCADYPPGPPGMPPSGSCGTVPISFKNTTENPNGLGTGLCYEALVD